MKNTSQVRKKYSTKPPALLSRLEECDDEQRHSSGLELIVSAAAFQLGDSITKVKYCNLSAMDKLHRNTDKPIHLTISYTIEEKYRNH